MAVHGLLIVVVSLFAEHSLQGKWASVVEFPGSRAQAQQLWCTGLAAQQHVESSWTRDQTCVLRWQADSHPLGYQEIAERNSCSLIAQPLNEFFPFSYIARRQVEGKYRQDRIELILFPFIVSVHVPHKWSGSFFFQRLTEGIWSLLNYTCPLELQLTLSQNKISF